MRTLTLALFALALPVANASAAGIPLFHHSTSLSAPAKPQSVRFEVHNAAVTDCVLVVGDESYRLDHFATRAIYAPVGSNVQIYDAQNSHLNGQTLLNVSASDADRTITVR